MTTKSDYVFKIVVIGNSGIGKTCMIANYLGNPVPMTYVQTKEKDVKEHQLRIKNSIVCLQIWDLSGDDNCRTLTSAHYFNAHAAIIAYSMSDSSSFGHVGSWITNIERTLGSDFSDTLPKSIIGLKCDSKKRCISQSQGENVASELGCKHYIGSCKVEFSFNEIFLDLTMRMLDKAKIMEKMLRVNNYVSLVDEKVNEQAPLISKNSNYSAIKTKDNDNNPNRQHTVKNEIPDKNNTVKQPSICDGCIVL